MWTDGGRDRSGDLAERVSEGGGSKYSRACAPAQRARRKRPGNGEAGEAGHPGWRGDGTGEVRGGLLQAPPFRRAENHRKALHTRKKKEINQTGHGVNAKQRCAVISHPGCVTDASRGCREAAASGESGRYLDPARLRHSVRTTLRPRSAPASHGAAAQRFWSASGVRADRQVSRHAVGNRSRSVCCRREKLPVRKGRAAGTLPRRPGI